MSAQQFGPAIAPPAQAQPGAEQAGPPESGSFEQPGGNAMAAQNLAMARQGTKGALPYKEEMEEKFGVTFDNVQPYFGPLAMSAAGASGAAGYANGNEVGFAEAGASKALVAHELTHVVQQGGDQQNAAGGSAGGAEAEADAAAETAMGGGSPEVGVGEAPTLRLAMDDPGEVTDSSGNPVSTHESPTPEDEHSQSGQSILTQVRILAPEEHPIQISGIPSEDALYERRDEPMCLEGYEVVGGWSGSVADPNHRNMAVEGDIFIDDTPDLLDVQQGGLGSCYFLAAMQAVLVSDPGHIHDLIDGDFSGARVTFYYLDGANADGSEKWSPDTYTIDNTLATYQNGELVGSHFRRADEPDYYEWYAGVLQYSTPMLTVFRKDYYQLALWAPLMEKAFARFAEEHGIDGRSGVTAGSGYTTIGGGGLEYETYPVLYGESATRGDEIDLAVAPGGDVVAANMEAVKLLLRLQTQQASTEEGGERLMLTASAIDDTVLLRFEIAATDAKIDLLTREIEALGSLWGTAVNAANRVEDMETHIEHCIDLIDAYRSAPDAPEAFKTAALRNLTNAVAQLTEPNTWPLLDSDTTPSTYADLLNQALIVQNLGDDESGGRRSIYASHAYTVRAVHLVTGTGEAFTGDYNTLTEEQARNIHADDSTVDLRNPHGTNEPDREGNGADDDSDEGNFSMSLRSFFTSFTAMDYGVVQR